MLQVLAELFFELVTGVTGHGLLWAFSLGRWKPLEGRDALATVVGILFWVGIAGLVFVLAR